jgi:hypothetical protein
MEGKKKNNLISRRNFMKTAGAVSAFSIMPSNLLGGVNKITPSDKLNIAGIGIGGREQFKKS